MTKPSDVTSTQYSQAEGVTVDLSNGPVSSDWIITGPYSTSPIYNNNSVTSSAPEMVSPGQATFEATILNPMNYSDLLFWVQLEVLDPTDRGSWVVDSVEFDVVDQCNIDIQTPTDGSTLPTPPTTISGTSGANSRVAIWIDDVYQTTVMSDANGDYIYTVPADSLVCSTGDHQIVAYNLDKQWAAVGDHSAAGTFLTLDASDPNPTNWDATGSSPWSSTSGGVHDFLTIGNYTYVMDVNGDNVDYYDISDPINPTLAGELDLGLDSEPWHMIQIGNYIYVAELLSGNVSYIDVSDPASPSIVGEIGLGAGSWPNYLELVGNYLYVTEATSDSISYIDVSDPANPGVPIELSLDLDSEPWFASKIGNYLYVAEYISGNISYIDVSDPASPSIVGEINLGTGSGVNHFLQVGNYLYVVEQLTGKVSYLDNSNPASPGIPTEIDLGIGSNPTFIVQAGNYVYISEYGSDSISYIDVSDPANPGSPVEINFDSGSAPSYISLFPDGQHILVALDQTDGNIATTNDAGVAILDTNTNSVVVTINGNAPAGNTTDSGIVSAPHAISNITVTTGGCNVTPPPPTPSIDMTTPADGSTLTSQTQDISGTGATPNGEVEVFVDGVSIGTTTADSNGNWTLVGSSLPCGEVEIEAVDQNGRVLIQGARLIDASDPDPANWSPITNSDPISGYTGAGGSIVDLGNELVGMPDLDTSSFVIFDIKNPDLGAINSFDLSPYMEYSFSAVRHQGLVWVIGRDSNDDTIIVNIDASDPMAITYINSINIGDTGGWNSGGVEYLNDTFAISNDGSTLFYTHDYGDFATTPSSAVVALNANLSTPPIEYDFDNLTGGGNDNEMIYSLELSPDGNYLYLALAVEVDRNTNNDRYIIALDISSFLGGANGSFTVTDSIFEDVNSIDIGAIYGGGGSFDIDQESNKFYLASSVTIGKVTYDPINQGELLIRTDYDFFTNTGDFAIAVLDLPGDRFAIYSRGGMIYIYDDSFNLLTEPISGVDSYFSKGYLGGFTQNSDTHTVTVDCQSATASIGLAKNVVSIEPSADPDQFTYTLDFYLENFGDANLDNISILDDLVAQGYSLVSTPTITIQSPPTNPNSTITVNQNYDGDSNPDLLDPANSSLAASDSTVIRLVVDLDISNATGLTNQATVNAQDSSDPTNTTTDTSTNGTNPDPDGDDDPDSTPGTDDQPTSMDPDLSPILGLAKTIGAVVNNGDGTYTIPLSFVIQNTGSGVAEQLSLVDDLQTQFLNPDSLTISVAPAVVSGSSTITINPDYTGDSNDPGGADILDDTNSSLNPGDTAIVTMTVVVDPSDNNLTTLSNQAEVTATNPTDNSTVSDLSTSGSNPDQDLDNLDNDQTNDNNQDPTDNDEVTQINLPDDNQSLPEADLSLTKTLETTGEINVEDTITFALKLTNNSTTNSAPGSITVTDILPTGLTYVNFTSANPNFNCSGVNTITCILDDDILPTLSETVYINTFVSSSVGDSISNIANLTTTSSIDPNNTNNIGLVSGIQITKPDPTPTDPTPTNPTPTTPTNQPNPSTPSKDINTNTLPSTGILSHPVTQLLLLISILSIPVLVARRTKSEK